MSATASIPLLLALLFVSSPSCGPTARSFAPAQEPLAPVSADWRRTDLGWFSLSLPADMKRIDVQGIDSSGWEFRNDETRLRIDLGLYSDDLLTYKDWPDFHQDNLQIDSRTVRLCTFRHAPDSMDSVDGDRVYIAAMYVADFGSGKNRITFWLTSKTTQGQQIAKVIFQSIKFK